MNVRLLMAALLAFGCIAPLHASSPVLNLVLPRGVQRGQTHTVIFQGERLADAQEVLLYFPGIQIDKLEVVDANQLRVTMTVAPDCPLGEQMAQVRTASGISEFRSFYVGALPALDENEPNSTFDTPQAVPLDVTIAGIIDNEDVDYFAVELKQGQRLSVEIEAIRLGTTLFDPYVAILDAKRFELAAADDSPVARQDAVAAIVAPSDGIYYVQVRETSYGGNGSSYYRLHLGSFPRPTAVYPAGGRRGEVTEVTYLGDPTGPIAARVTAPTEFRRDFGVYAEDTTGIAPSANLFRISDVANILEAEPNDEITKATPATIPAAFNGIIDKPGDVDFFRFTAKQGETLDIECFARRIRTGLDPVLHIYHADGRVIAGDDDARPPDSYLRFQAPEAGDYIVRVTDHLARGQADFVYRVELTSPSAQLSLEIPRVDRYSQYRQAIFVPRGGRYGTLVIGNRVNFGGPLVLDGHDLPPSITMRAEPMVENLNMMPVVFSAPIDAPLGGKLVDLVGRHADPQQTIQGSYRNASDFVLGPPNNNLFYSGVVDRVPVIVVDALPFNLEIVEPQVPIVRDGVMNLRIRAVRNEGFTQAISIQFPFRPPGIGAPPAVTIPEGQTEVDYVLNANNGAQLGKWPIYAIGSADVNGPAWACTQLAHLEIAEPFVAVELQRTSCEQGQVAQVLCKLTQLHPFEGQAQLQLIGLPPKTTCDALTFDKDTTELVFAIKTEADSPVGSHKNLFGQITITQQGQSIVATSGVTELQIDQPLPAAPTAAPTPAAPAETPAAAPPPVAKPLSRLEKLRAAAKQARETPTPTPSP